MRKGARETRTGELLNDRYELLEALQSSEESEVYRANDRRRERRVRVRLLRPEHALKPEIVQRFVDASSTLASVGRGSASRVLAVDSDETGVPFVVEEDPEAQPASQPPQVSAGAPAGGSEDLVAALTTLLDGGAPSRSALFGDDDLGPSEREDLSALFTLAFAGDATPHEREDLSALFALALSGDVAPGERRDHVRVLEPMARLDPAPSKPRDLVHAFEPMARLDVSPSGRAREAPASDPTTSDVPGLSSPAPERASDTPAFGDDGSLEFPLDADSGGGHAAPPIPRPSPPPVPPSATSSAPRATPPPVPLPHGTAARVAHGSRPPVPSPPSLASRPPVPPSATSSAPRATPPPVAVPRKVTSGAPRESPPPPRPLATSKKPSVKTSGRAERRSRRAEPLDDPVDVDAPPDLSAAVAWTLASHGAGAPRAAPSAEAPQTGRTLSQEETRQARAAVSRDRLTLGGVAGPFVVLLFAASLMFAVPLLVDPSGEKARTLLGDHVRLAAGAFAGMTIVTLVRTWAMQLSVHPPMLRPVTITLRVLALVVCGLCATYFLPPGSLGPVERAARGALPWIASGYYLFLGLFGLLQAVREAASRIFLSLARALLYCGAFFGLFQVLQTTVLDEQRHAGASQSHDSSGLLGWLTGERKSILDVPDAGVAAHDFQDRAETGASEGEEVDAIEGLGEQRKRQAGQFENLKGQMEKMTR